MKSRTNQVWFAVTSVLLGVALAPWADAATKQMPITFGGYTNRSETLTNFPVLVVLSNNVGGNFSYTDFISTNGYDLRFATNSTSTSWLDYEIESWNTNAGQASYVWIRVPTIPPDGSGSIYAKWGDSGNSSQLACTTNGAVWTNGYGGVWHLSQDTGGAAPQMRDSSGNGNHGTDQGTPVSTNGMIGRCLYLSGGGSGPCVTVPDADSIDPTNAFTLSAWIKRDESGVQHSIIEKYNWVAGYGNYIMRASSGNQLNGFTIAGTGYSVAGNATLNASQWYYVTVTYDKNASSTLSAFANGILNQSVTSATQPLGSTLTLKIGAKGDDAGTSFKGWIDEARISTVARSTNWVWAEYLNQASNTVFNNYGAMSSAGGAATTTYKLPMAFTNYTRAEVLTNFPVLVVLSNGLYGTFNYNTFTAPATGGDLRFWDSTETTNLDFEIESWNTNGTSYAWVRVPLLSSNTTIYAKWGGADTALPACTTNGAVWTGGFLGVWHLATTNGSLAARDSTSNACHAIAVSGMAVTNGLIDGGAKTTADPNRTDYINFGNVSNFNFRWNSTFTLELWINPNGTVSGDLMGKASPTAAGYYRGWYLTAMRRVTGYPGTAIELDLNCRGDLPSPILNVGTAEGTLSTGVWQHVVATYDGSGQSAGIRFFINGVEQAKAYNNGSLSSSDDITTTNNFTFGARDAYDWGRQGSRDEHRISSIVRSSNYVWACYLNQGSNAFFNGYGTVATVSSGGPVITNGSVTGVATGGATFNGTLTSTGSSACAVGVLWGTDTNAWGNSAWFNGGAVNSLWTNNTPFSTNITLSPNLNYYYAYVASNASGVATASPQYLITGEVTVEATDNSAKYLSDNGVFTVSRPSDLTNSTLVVNYTMGGTAVTNLDYTALSGSVTLNAGVSNTTLTVTPLRYPNLARTAVLTLASGAYATGTLSSATVTIQPKDPIYVTTNGTGTGTSWADATSLTNALRIGVTDQAIWLAQGTYTNTATFTVATNGVALYGGFTNGMATLSERNWTNYPTILDGNAQNIRVVTVTASGATLDGLTIRNTRPTTFSAGGITKQNAGSLTLANCRIVDHAGQVGTAGYYWGVTAYFTAGSILMTNCVVANNSMAHFNSYGLGLYASGANLDLVDCQFTNQYANAFDNRSQRGAALYFDNGRMTAVRTDFLDNNAGTGNGGGGGAVYIGSTAGTAANFTNCVFRGNVIPYDGRLSGGNGAAVWAVMHSASTARFVNCTFAFNTAVYGSGGALYLSSGTLELKNCLIWSNSIAGTGQKGIDIYQAGGNLRVSYSGVMGTATPYIHTAAGTVSLYGVMTNDPLFASSTDLHVQSPGGRWNGTTFVTTDTAYSPAIDAGDPADAVGAEVAPNGGRINLGAYGGTAQASKSTALVAPQVANRSPLTNDYTRMILRGELTNNAPVIASVYICYGTNNVAGETTNGWGAVSLIYPPPPTGTVFSTMTGYLLTNTTYYYRCFATNAAGGSWAPVDSFVTATNYPQYYGVGGGTNVIHVRAGAGGVADGSDWYNAYPTLLAGLAAIGGTRTNIWITGGSYTEGAELTLGSSAMIVGGFAGGETAVSQRALTNAAGVVTNYTGINGANSYRCLSMTASSVTLDTLSFSNAPSGDSTSALYKNNAGTVVLNNCRAERNQRRGVELNNCTVQMTGCELRNNTGSPKGIGGTFTSSTVTMSNCVVQANTNTGIDSNGRGNGLYAESCTLTLVDCRIQDQYGHPFNNRGARGGGLAVVGGTLRVLRTDFTGNRNTGHGGGGAALWLNSNVNAAFSNCVFRGNEVQDPYDTPVALSHNGYGGVAYSEMSAAGTARFVNCTFANNSNSCTLGVGGMLYSTGGTIDFKNCILWSNRVAQVGDFGKEIFATNVASCVVTGSYICITGTNLPQVVANNATVAWGTGVVTNNPLFASTTDVHLKSAAGRWDPVALAWTNDTATSPAIDAGNPTDPVGAEPAPNGGLINLGAYGGTWQASKTPSAPVITNGDLVATSMNEDAGELDLSTLGLAASDPYGGVWVWTNVAASGPANGAVAVNGTGTNPTWAAFTYTPATNFNGTNTFDVMVTGQNTMLSDTVTVRVVVNPVNDAPVNTVAPDYTGGTTFEVDTDWTVTSGTWDDTADTNATYDGTGFSYAYQWYCSNSPAATPIAGATSATYHPGSQWTDSNLCAAVSCIDTGNPGSSTGTVFTAWRRVTGMANTPPVILVSGVSADNVSTNLNEDAGAFSLEGLPLSATDDGSGGPTVTWSSSAPPAHGTVSVSGTGTDTVSWTVFTYKPDTNWNGTDSFVVRATDAIGLSDSITVTVVVAAVNDPPVNTVAPGYTGTRLVGSTLTATNGIWNDNIDTNALYTAAHFTGAATFAYQWWRSGYSDGAGAVAIPGATAAGYTLTEADRWQYLAAAVTCTDNNYPGSSCSNTAFSSWQREATAPPIYVTTNGTGAGTSWADASSLVNALLNSVNGSILWLAQGTYTNTATFTLSVNNVKVYGGFTTNMTAMSERNWTNYPTILDGNAQALRVVTVTADGVRLDGLTLRNGKHTATAGGGITKQNAGSLTLANCRIVDHYGTASYQNGLGAYFTAGSILMTNCVVANNTRDIFNSAGMGVYASGANLDLVDCLFTNQYGSYWDTRSEKGAALYFDNGRLTAVRTDFLENKAGTDNGGGGGAVYLGSTAGTAANFTNCVFRGNVIPWQSGVLGPGNGAAVWSAMHSASTARFVNCTFAYNTAVYGSGGALYLSSGTLELKNCLMWSNSIAGTGQYGIDIYQAGGALQVNYCGLAGSGAPCVYSAGGTMSVSGVMTNDPLFASSTDLHVQSPAGRWSPAIGDFVTTDTAYSPAIDAGDSSDAVGAEVAPNGGRINLGAYGGTAQASKSPPLVAPQVANRSVLTNDSTRMILRGELTNNATASSVYICYGTNSVAAETTNGWGTVSLISGSQPTGVVFTLLTPYLLTNTTYYYRCFATNAAGGSWAPVESFLTVESYPTFYGVGGGSNVIHVRAGATGVADGSDWHNAYTTILAGLAAIGGTRTNVWITGGSYTEGIELSLPSSATVVGGFAGGETAVSQRALTNAAGVVTNYTGINGANAYRCLSMTASSVTLDTLCVSNAPSGVSALYKNNAGTVVLNNCRAERNNLRGMELNNCTVQMTGCQLRENVGGGFGIGGSFSGSTVTMSNCVVQANTNNGVNCNGNGLYANGCTLTLVDCRIQDQYGHPFDNRGGRGCGLAFDGGTLRVLRTDFTGNRNTGHGGGGAALWLNSNVNAAFTNCVFRGNEVMDPLDTPVPLSHNGYGGAVFAEMSAAGTARFVNCTFGYNSNSCTLGMGGMLYSTGGRTEFKNCILWGSSVAQAGNVGTEIFAANVASCVVTGSYTCITGTNLPQVVANDATVAWGQGLLVADPLLASGTDAHPKSTGGRWNPSIATWVLDSEHSPCIDAGDPADDYSMEPQPNGRRINMGAYGGTVYASRSIYVGSVFRFR